VRAISFVRALFGVMVLTGPAAPALGYPSGWLDEKLAAAGLGAAV